MDMRYLDFALLCLAVAGCTGSTQEASTSTVTTTEPTTTVATSTTMVETTSTTEPDASLAVTYRTGRLVGSRLFHAELYRYYPDNDPFPHLVALIDEPSTADGSPIFDEEVTPGTYELRSFLRPCADQECRQPGQPVLGCATSLSVAPASTVRATIIADGENPCAIETDGGTQNAAVLSMDLTLEQPGGPGCEPESPQAGSSETIATSTSSMVGWGIIFAPRPIPVGLQTKMVFRLSGDGEGFSAVATHEDGTRIEPDWGPNDHGFDGSNYGRPGHEWGYAFTFPHAGCWNITLSQGDETVETWFRVRDA
jgi:hypothetical protein